MKVVAIEIAEAIETEIVTFLEANSEAASMRFTRFIDLGGKQVELFLYPPQLGASVWCTIGIKSIFRADEGDCVVYSVSIPSTERRFENVLVNPERSKLPAMVERILNFIQEDLLRKASERVPTLESGGLALGSEQELDNTAKVGPDIGESSRPMATQSDVIEGSDSSPLNDISEIKAKEEETGESSDSDLDDSESDSNPEENKEG